MSEHNVDIQLLQLRAKGYTDVDPFTFQDMYMHGPNEIFIETAFRMSEATQVLEQIQKIISVLREFDPDDQARNRENVKS